MAALGVQSDLDIIAEQRTLPDPGLQPTSIPQINNYTLADARV